MSTITQFPSGNTQYRIEFDYLARTFVVVTLVNSSNPTLNRVLEVGRDYRFLNPTMIEMLVDQSGFDIVRIHRQTGTDLVVDFRNGSVLTASDLTNAELQAIHIAEEGRDQTVDLAKEYADAAGSSAGNAKDSEDEARRLAASIKAASLFGYITRRSFEKGFNVTIWNEVLLWEEDGDYYRWDGTLPKNVPSGSTPETSGGVGLGAWVSVGDASLRSNLASKFGSSLVLTAQDGVTIQRLASGYSYAGDSTEDVVITSNTESIRDHSTGLFWVYEGAISSPLTVPAGTVPPAQPLARYTSTNWRCVGLLNGYKETNAKNYGAKCDGVTDDYYAYQLALYHTKSHVTHVGDARIATSTLIKPVGVSIVGASGYVGAQLGINLPATTFTFDGPYGKDKYAIDNGESAGTEDSGRIQHVYLRAINDSRDNLNAVKLTKAGQLMDCGVLNFWTGVKYDGGSAYVQIHRNNINSCNCCIDAAGSESHITNNHGYNDSLRTSAQFRPAILIRSAGNIVTENKFFGDGANTPKCVEIWGPGNVVANNVFDAFTDIGILITCNDASVLPDNNLISGNLITGIGDSSDPANTFRAGVVISNSGAGAGNITGTIVYGNSMYNRRADRQMQYGVVINAVSGSLPDSRTIYNTLITGNTFGFGITGRKVIALGANHSGSRSNNNSGVITEAIGSGTYSNGEVIQHGMSRPPEFIEFTLIDSGTPVAISFSAVTDTTFTIRIRDSSGGISGTRAVAWKALRLTP